MVDIEIEKCRACLQTDKDQLIYSLDVKNTKELFELTQIPVNIQQRLLREVNRQIL